MKIINIRVFAPSLSLLEFATDARINIKLRIKNYSCISGYTLLCFIIPTNALIVHESLDTLTIYCVKNIL